MALSRALLERVASGQVRETLRLARPGRAVTFGKLDAVSPAYGRALLAARARGFEAVLRLAGGRAAVFHEGSLSLGHALPDPDPRAGIRERFEHTAGLVAAALRRLGVDAQVGEVPGEYCPGAWSVNAGGRVKLAGFGQRVVSGAAYVGGVLMVDDADRVREVLGPVYHALGLDWDPATAGAVADEAPGVTLDDVLDSLRAEYGRERELVAASLDEATLELGHARAPEHVPGR
jgi:lipoate-protein ligase A